MNGPFKLEDVDYMVSLTKGAYILSRDGKTAHYVGRSDSNLRTRIKTSANEGRGYHFFWFETTTSPMKAHQLECEWYHKYSPPDNSIHPAVPGGTYWTCPVCN